ncbi:DNA/RNA nuclease SfsA [Shewanella cyperi]|uniref:Sugar fermentation stimulation protein homolog n=1 Tax=Shewanella cyperi TaxID=2814292 RepID=A0A974XLB7_9GAMM|nr:DNA/RNA nuclease SfsA [Shewanella cyperi]QSX29353.1 DNA/RNA nuclease SfsA [Shewanella cyperi]QSX40105.1 DNA/RNA nuclease SfsA [Shewanella cyperi]
MQFDPPLSQGILLRRYKRFLADVQLPDGSEITLHCPNTGSMRHCLFPGEPVWFSTSDNPKRKYAHTWELARNDQGQLIGINTGRANALAEEAILDGRIAALSGYQSLKREVKYGEENSRIDILLSQGSKPDCFIEIKSCTLLEQGPDFAPGTGCFPDAVSERGQKHLRELMAVRAAGKRAVLLFVVQHSGIEKVMPADHIDPRYGELLREAKSAGVELLAWAAELSPREVKLIKELPVEC